MIDNNNMQFYSFTDKERTQNMPKHSDISINDRFVKALETPQNTAHKIYWDGKTTGFGVRITQSGAVSFVLRYVLNGRERKYTIGNYPTHSALSARETAIKLKGEIAKGFDPLEKRRQYCALYELLMSLHTNLWWSFCYSSSSNCKLFESCNSIDYTKYRFICGNLLFFLDAIYEFHDTTNPLQLIGVYNAMYTFENAVIEIAQLCSIKYDKCAYIRNSRNDFFAHPEQTNTNRFASFMQYSYDGTMNFVSMKAGLMDSRRLDEKMVKYDIENFAIYQIEIITKLCNKLDQYVQQSSKQRN